MLYLGIDLHSKQLTINLRDENGDVLLRRQVSTRGEEPQKFLNQIREQAGESGYIAIVEVRGFHDWLAELLPQCGCREVVWVQPDTRSRRKTDRRDAQNLSELLWINRERLLVGKKVEGLRRVVLPSTTDREDRRLTQMRRDIGAELTRTINAVKHLLRRLNYEQHCPTKGIQTVKARHWLAYIVKLPELDRFEMDHLLARWKLLETQKEAIELRISQRAAKNAAVQLLKTVPGIGNYSGLAFAASVGDVQRFATSRSLSNYWGLTPTCRNSGESGQRLGSITKEGSKMARFLLGQLVLHVLKKDATMREWYRRIKLRRGSKIARVAVMRRLSVIFWHMLRKGEVYEVARPQKQKPPRHAQQRPKQEATETPAKKPRGRKRSLGALPPNPRSLSQTAQFEVRH